MAEFTSAEKVNIGYENEYSTVEKLIADNKYKQYEIAEMVGYKDFGYYIKVFKKRYGITPNEFRKYI